MEYAFLLALVPAFLVVGLVTGGSSDDDLDDMDHAEAQDSELPVVPLHTVMFGDEAAMDDDAPPPPQS